MLRVNTLHLLDYNIQIEPYVATDRYFRTSNDPAQKSERPQQ